MTNKKRKEKVKQYQKELARKLKYLEWEEDYYLKKINSKK